VLSWLGIARDLRQPPLELLESKRIDRGAGDPMGIPLSALRKL
jgi:hypothetical protein